MIAGTAALDHRRILFLVGAAASFWASRTGKKRDRRFWIGTSILLVLLGLNKELDLQTVLTDTARYLAHYEGWYDYRRIVQGLFCSRSRSGVSLRLPRCCAGSGGLLCR